MQGNAARGKRYGSMFERLVANSVKPEDQNENGCWLWVGPVDHKRVPYGQVSKRVDGKHVNVKAHREMENQCRCGDDDVPLLPTETIDHLCGVSLCINPDHWRIETRERNSQLAQERRRKWHR